MKKKILVVFGCFLMFTNFAQQGFKDSILTYHNSARNEVGVENMKWNNELANNAKTWATYLATNNTFKHSNTKDEGENLWMGTASAYTYRNMIDTWVNEKTFFVPNAFPNVSTNGDWTKVGHYTQIIWQNTTEVGCAIATANGNDVLVCRYKKPGNVMGQKVF